MGLLYLFDAHPLHGVTDTSGLVDVLFVPLVMTLAIGTGSFPALLSTRVMVFGGQVSFCLYMVHDWCTRRGYGSPSSSSSRCRATAES